MACDDLYAIHVIIGFNNTQKTSVSVKDVFYGHDVHQTTY